MLGGSRTTPPLYDRVLFTTRLVLKHPDITKVMMVDALTGGDLNFPHSLYKLVSEMLEGLQRDGKIDADIDLEISTMIHIGSIASTLLLGEHNNYTDIEDLAQRFAREWSRIVAASMFKR